MPIDLFKIEDNKAELCKEFKQQIIDALNDDRVHFVECSHDAGRIVDGENEYGQYEARRIGGTQVTTMCVVLLPSVEKPLCGRIELMITVKG